MAQADKTSSAAPRRLTPSAARRESKRTRRARTDQILDRLDEEYPEARTALHHEKPLELLVATILSAQCTDKRVNMVTPELFRRYGSAADYAQAELPELEDLIRSTGFFRNKSKALKALGQALVTDHAGEVPRNMVDLSALPGVGRKTANVVLGNAFGIDEGIVVDTHVKRISQLLGLTDQKNPEKIEQDLMALVPKSSWTPWSHMLIEHGRKVCIARKPRCTECVLADICPSAEI